MVINKVNVFIREWYYQLWCNQLKLDNVPLDDFESRALNILYKDIEKNFMNNHKEAAQSLTTHLE